MANRITHTNNSAGHDGTYVYRSTSPMDPQALPAPIADAPPAAGEAFEYIDSDSLTDGTYYYRTQDHEGGQVSAVSDEVSMLIGDDFSTAQIGDEIGGGIYAGMITYADARQYHIVAGKAASEATLPWGYDGTQIGASDSDDGQANTGAAVAAGLEAGSGFEHCVNYNAPTGEDDWYFPASNEMALIITNLVGSAHPEFTYAGDGWHHVSQEYASNPTARVWLAKWSTGDLFENGTVKTTAYPVRPIRRVAV